MEPFKPWWVVDTFDSLHHSGDEGYGGDEMFVLNQTQCGQQRKMQLEISRAVRPNAPCCIQANRTVSGQGWSQQAPQVGIYQPQRSIASHLTAWMVSGQEGHTIGPIHRLSPAFTLGHIFVI